MTLSEAQKFARNKTITATTVILFLMVALFFIGEVKGDFANGILFFLKSIVIVYAIILLIVLYGLTWYFAGRAAKEIIFEKKNFLLVSLKYAALISLAICLALMLIEFTVKGSMIIDIAQLIRGYLLPLFLKTLVWLFLCWLWATRKMKALQPTIDEIGV